MLADCRCCRVHRHSGHPFGIPDVRLDRPANAVTLEHVNTRIVRNYPALVQTHLQPHQHTYAGELTTHRYDTMIVLRLATVFIVFRPVCRRPPRRRAFEKLDTQHIGGIDIDGRIAIC